MPQGGSITRGLIDRDSFDRLDAAAQEKLLGQTLLLWLTALDLAGRDPDAWEAAAFNAAVEHLASRAPQPAYREIECMLLPPAQRPPIRQGAGLTAILRVDMAEDGAPGQSPDRRQMRRRLLQLSAVQPSLDAADARRSVLTRARRKAAAQLETEDAGDD